MGLKDRDPKTLPGLTLAYVGDCVFELVVRSTLVEKGLNHVKELNKIATGIVSAKAQAAFMKSIEEKLEDDERDAYRRGKNANSTSVPKSATRVEYHTATGFEALMGYLYLEGRTDRILEICAPLLKEAPRREG
ncbi:MAG: ribonuclease III [Lachnospiraceae bacterium]|nr:ribonuclease III [Lachnospiraceae bacterium]